MIRYRLIEKEIEYDGSQLASHWIYRNFDISGDAAVAFIGRCHVDLQGMVDLADVKEGAHIYSPRMLHFIVEIFDPDLWCAVMLQRLLVVNIKEQLEDLSTTGKVIRKGDDLFHKGIADVILKLSVSIATVSRVSKLIHVGVNVKTHGTPIPTAGLSEMGVDPVLLGERVLERFAGEVEGMENARCKVRPV